MGGSTADEPATPESLRASDAERDHAVSELRNEFAEGRLSHETFMYRMQSALDARRRGQLVGLFTDLPPCRPGLMARIKALLRGEDPEALQSRPDGSWGIPRAQQIAGPEYEQLLPRVLSPPPGWENPPPLPAPPVFPPGIGLRFTIRPTRVCDLCLRDLPVSRIPARLAPLPLDAIVSSPLERCQQTAAAIAATRDGQQVLTEDRVGECHYGDWTGQPLRKLAREQLWRVVQAHPSAVTFPGPDGESMPDMQHRAVAAVRDWNARLGKDATYLICSHGDVIKAIVADSLGLHLDQCQRIQADPCSLTVIRYTPSPPFPARMK